MAEPEVEAPPVRGDGLQLEEHRSFQEKLWVVERCAWLMFGAIVVAAILGLTGAGGYFSHGSKRIEGGEVDFPRLARWQATDTFTVAFHAGEAERALTLSPAFAETFQIEDIQPEPERSQARPDGEQMIFNLVAGAPATVRLHVRALRPGIAQFRIAVDDGARQGITSIILP